MNELKKYGTADSFMTFVARMEMYPMEHIEEIKSYLTEQYLVAASDTYGRALEACVSQFLTQLIHIVKEQ